GATHGSDFLPRLDFLLLPDQHCIVMGVGTQVIIVMFYDNKITVTAQSVTGIYNASICGRGNSLSLTSCDIDPFISPLGGREVFEYFAVSWPAPGGDRRTGGHTAGCRYGRANHRCRSRCCDDSRRRLIIR